MPKTTAQRKADERERRHALGFVAVTIWIKPTQRDQLRKYAKRLERQGKKK